MNSSRLVWFVPSKLRPMFFRGNGRSFKVDVIWPSLVFCCDPSLKLRIATYGGNGRPNLSQRLYHAPLWNIYRGTRLCIGSSAQTDVIDIGAMKIWEEAIFRTNFTHSNHDTVIAKGVKGDKNTDEAYIRFIRQKSKARERIRVSEMTALNSTLEHWVKKVK